MTKEELEIGLEGKCPREDGIEVICNKCLYIIKQENNWCLFAKIRFLLRQNLNLDIHDIPSVINKLEKLNIFNENKEVKLSNIDLVKLLKDNFNITDNV